MSVETSQFGSPDPGLQRMANTSGPGPDITLFLPAGVLSGGVISAERFFELLSQSRLADKATQALVSEPAREHPTVRYIHLEKVMLSGTGGVPIKMPLPVRVQLSHVSAWTLGLVGKR